MIAIRDNFVPDRERLQAEAQKADYQRWGSSPVLRAEIPTPPSVLQSLTGLFGAPPQSTYTKFHFTPARDKERLFIHSDPKPYSGVLYLQSPEDCGTTFFRHRATGLKAMPDATTLSFLALERGEDPQAWVAQLSEDRYRPERWEPWLRIPARSNRFICFTGRLFHGPTDVSGSSPEEGRTLLVVFIETKKSGGIVKEASGATSPLIGKKIGWELGRPVG